MQMNIGPHSYPQLKKGNIIALSRVSSELEVDLMSDAFCLTMNDSKCENPLESANVDRS